MEEPFRRGELVTLREFDSDAEPLGRIVSVTDDGASADVMWHKRADQHDTITREPTADLRRVHESELDP
jgi:hypothetical protein